MVAGILLLTAGLIGIADSVVVLSRPLTPDEIAQYQNATATERVVGVAAGLTSLYAQAFAVVAGVMALQKRNWTLATACAVLALLAGGPLGFVSSLLALLGLVFVAAARREFTV